MLDIRRAKEILQSPNNIQVLYQGSPVWIESVRDNNAVEVTLLDKNERVNVPLNELVEKL